MKINVDKSFVNSGKEKKLYTDAIKQTNLFIKKYNDSLRSKIHKSFLNEFYFYKTNHYNADIVFSSKNISLIYLEKNTGKENIFNIYFTDLDPQIFIQELKHNFTIKIRPHAGSFNWMVCPEDTKTFMTEFHLNNFPIPLGINKNSFVSMFFHTITLSNPNTDSILTELPGLEILIGSLNILNFKEAFDTTAFHLVEFEVKKQYVKSELFRQALTHPILRSIAQEINIKKAKSDSKNGEYPQWEFEQDIKKMKETARQNNIKDNYVDEMLKDSQYYPVSGTLIFYYDTQIKFMMQWIFINLILLIIVFLSMAFFKPDIKIIGFLSTILLAVNGYVFSKKPELINITYWIIPSLILLCSILLLYFQSITKLFKQ